MVRYREEEATVTLCEKDNSMIYDLRNEQVDSLREPHPGPVFFQQLGIHLVDPRPRRVHHELGLHVVHLVSEQVAHPGADDPCAVHEVLFDERVVGDVGPVLGSLQHVLDADAFRHLHLAVVVDHRADEVLAVQEGLFFQRLLYFEEAVGRHALVPGQKVVQNHACPQLRNAHAVAFVHRHEEGEGLD